MVIADEWAQGGGVMAEPNTDPVRAKALDRTDNDASSWTELDDTEESPDAPEVSHPKLKEIKGKLPLSKVSSAPAFGKSAFAKQPLRGTAAKSNKIPHSAKSARIADSEKSPVASAVSKPTNNRDQRKLRIQQGKTKKHGIMNSAPASAKPSKGNSTLLEDSKSAQTASKALQPTTGMAGKKEKPKVGQETGQKQHNRSPSSNLLTHVKHPRRGENSKHLSPTASQPDSGED